MPGAQVILMQIIGKDAPGVRNFTLPLSVKPTRGHGWASLPSLSYGVAPSTAESKTRTALKESLFSAMNCLCRSETWYLS